MRVSRSHGLLEAMCLPASARRTAPRRSATPAHIAIAAQRLNSAATAVYGRTVGLDHRESKQAETNWRTNPSENCSILGQESETQSYNGPLGDWWRGGGGDDRRVRCAELTWPRRARIMTA